MLKRISDEVCLQFGVQPYDKTLTSKPVISAYNEWEHLKKGTSWKQRIRNTIDLLIPTVRSIDELLSELERRGYTIKRGKYISVKAPEQQRFVRTKTLGDAYTEKNIIKRISKAVQINREKFHDSYYNLCGEFIRACGAYRFTKPAIAVHDFYYGQYVTLVKENLNSIDMVRNKLSEAEKLCTETDAAVNSAYEKYSEAKNILKLAERYFNEMNGVQRRFPKSKIDKAAAAVVKQYNLKSEADVDDLRDGVAAAKSELNMLKSNYAAVSAEVRKYRDIADTYDMLNSGEDYVSRLVREARDRCSLDEWDEVVRQNCEAVRAEISRGKIIANGKIQRDIKVTLNNEQKEILCAYLHLVEKCSPMIMSGVADAMSNNNIIANIKNDELEELRYNLQQLVKALKASDYNKAEIFDLLEQMPEYSPILGDFENLYMEVT